MSTVTLTKLPPAIKRVPDPRPKKGEKRVKLKRHHNVDKFPIDKISVTIGRSQKIRSLTKDEQKDVEKKWQVTMGEVREVFNCCWLEWMAWHTGKGHPAKLRSIQARWNDAAKLAETDKKAGEAVKTELRKELREIPAVPLYKEFNLYQIVRDRFPHLSAGLTGFISEKLFPAKVLAYAGYRSNWPGWMQVLTFRQRPGSETTSTSIPLNGPVCNLYPPAAEGEPWRAKFRLNPESDPDSDAYVVDLFTGYDQKDENGTIVKRVMVKQRAALDKLRTGEWSYRSAALEYDEKRKRWELAVMYRLPSVVNHDLDHSKEVHLFALHDIPFVMRCGDVQEFPAARRLGKVVSQSRRRIARVRGVRNEVAKSAPGAAKGRGRKRSYDHRMKAFKRQWKDFTRTATQQMARRIFSICLQYNWGTVVYHQPGGDISDEMYLAHVGTQHKGDDFQAVAGWPWYALGERLQHLGQEIGVEVKIVKVEKRGHKGLSLPSHEDIGFFREIEGMVKKEKTHQTPKKNNKRGTRRPKTRRPSA